MKSLNKRIDTLWRLQRGVKDSPSGPSQSQTYVVSVQEAAAAAAAAAAAEEEEEEDDEEGRTPTLAMLPPPSFTVPPLILPSGFSFPSILSSILRDSISLQHANTMRIQCNGMRCGAMRCDLVR